LAVVDRMKRADIRLDILIKREEDYYLAHCLQFDIVATDDSLVRVKEAIIDLCLAHIENSVQNDNLAYLFSPAPKEVWAEYLTMTKDASCEVSSGSFKEKIPSLPPFIIQEVICHGQDAPLS
jgi:hypothetical protein